MNKVIEQVKEYYGKRLKTKRDLKTSACCCTEKPTSEVCNLLMTDCGLFWR